MKRAVLLTAAWLAATVVTGTVAWAAVRLAGEQAGQEAVAPLSAEQVAALAAAMEARTTSTVPGGTGTTVALSITTVPAGTTTAAIAGTTTTTAAVPTVVAQRVSGGSLVVSLAGGRLSLVGASPAQGFAVEVKETGPEEVLVVFESSDAEVRVRAFISGGEAAFEVSGDD